jgi:hypothetical protein
MAIVHPDAVLRPTKLELAQRWLAATDWFDGDPAAIDVKPRFSYRFDDPAGKVGVETIVVRDGERFIQLPLTYREAPLDGLEPWLVTTMDHSVLGKRWIYDGVGDPVLVTAFVTAIVGGRPSAGLEFATDGEHRTADTLIRAQGTGAGSAPSGVELIDVQRSGSDSTVHTSCGDLRIPHLLDPSTAASGPALLGGGAGLGDDVLLAELTTA